jgi:hypothetical protein
MRSIVSSFVVVAALSVAHAALAQQNGDAQYCRTLARAYLSQNPVQATPNVADATLADSCGGDTQGTIAILKQKLASHGIDLPKPTTAGAGE